jgi:hypothetical protein
MTNNKNKKSKNEIEFCNHCGTELMYDEVGICTVCELNDASNDLSHDLSMHLDGYRSSSVIYD